MQLSWLWKCLGVLVILHCFYSANGLADTNNGRSVKTKELNVSVPLKNILLKLEALLKKGLDIGLLIQTIVDALTNCLPSSSQTEKYKAFVLPTNLKRDIEIKIQGQLMDHSTTMRSKKRTPTAAIECNPQLKKYCQSDDFKTIHEFLWEEDNQFKDVIKFFFKFGYPNVYITIRAVYESCECPQELIGKLPSGPENHDIQQPQALYNSNYAFIRNQVLSDSSFKTDKSIELFKAEKCNITEILTNLIKSGSLELLQLVETVLQEVTTDPSLHFLIGKIQEPVKGPSFRKFRLLEPVRKVFVDINKAILNDATIKDILELVKSLTGIDLANVNIIETVLDIVEALLWQNFTPVPPFEP